VEDNLIEPEYHEEDSSGGTKPRLPMTIYARRPTEDALVLHEGSAASEARWEQFEKEIARILAVMRGQQWHPNSLRRAAKALCESVKGTSNYNIAQLLEVDWHTATQIILHYREQLVEFLAQSPLVQGLIRAEGELRSAVVGGGQRNSAQQRPALHRHPAARCLHRELLPQRQQGQTPRPHPGRTADRGQDSEPLGAAGRGGAHHQTAAVGQVVGVTGKAGGAGSRR
jgi:hypothetical protein